MTEQDALVVKQSVHRIIYEHLVENTKTQARFPGSEKTDEKKTYSACITPVPLSQTSPTTPHSQPTTTGVSVSPVWLHPSRAHLLQKAHRPLPLPTLGACVHRRAIADHVRPQALPGHLPQQVESAPPLPGLRHRADSRAVGDVVRLESGGALST